MIAGPSFEFCAFKFLSQWEENECALHNSISAAPTEKSIDAALKYFGIARTFRGSSDRLSSILNLLIDVRNKTLPPIEKVECLANEFKKKFGKKNTSAASKFLWLSYRSPFIICDSRAVNALGFRDLQTAGYAEFARKWKEEYAKQEEAIGRAVEHLPVASAFLRYPISDDALLQMAREPWFVERVFDIFLWEAGKPTRQVSVRIEQ